jgi:hypothetical protein
MRNGFLGSMAALAAGTGLAWGQSAGPVATATPGKAKVSEPAPITQVQGLGDGAMPPPIPVADSAGGLNMPLGVGPVYPTPAIFEATNASQLPQLPGSDTPGPEAPRLWFTADYLLWFTKAMPNSYPLVTTSNVSSAGRLQQPTTTVLYGGEDVNFGVSSGFRVFGGTFRDADRRNGWELGGFSLMNKSKEFVASSDGTGNPVIARPFVNVNNSAQSSILITAPNFATGGVVTETSTSAWGVEANYVCNLYRAYPTDPQNRVLNFIAGPRYMQIEESLNVSSVSDLLPGNTAPAAFGVFPATFGAAGDRQRLVIQDMFKVTNQFYGGQIGLQSEWRRGRWTVLGNYKLAAGNMVSSVEIEGKSTLTRGVQAFSGGVRGGVLATPANIDKSEIDRFTFMPEINLTLGYQITPGFSVGVGYNYLYIADLVRPGEIVNPRQQPGNIPASANFGAVAGNQPQNDIFKRSEFYLHGINFSLNVRY